MNKNSVLTQYDKELRLRIMYPEARREITGEVVRLIRQAPGLNLVAFTFANEHQLDHVIDRELDYFAPLPQPFTWKVYEHDRLPSLKAKLTARNFVEEGGEALMALDVNAAPACLFEPVQADIRRITDRDGLADVVRVLDSVWGGQHAWVYDRLGLHLQIPGYLSVYVAYVDNRPASVAWTYFPRGHFATLYAGSTIAEHRHRGLYTNLLAKRLHEIRNRGYSFAVVEAGEMSKPIVAKHGFQQISTVWDYEWKRK
jgi:GNAT superfamily N-acetyltransferase